MYEACLRAYKAKNAEAPNFKLRCNNGIPLKRGLGSSGAAIVGGLFAGDLLSGGSQMSKERLLSLAVELEGHPDNVAASVYGGLRLVAPGGEQTGVRAGPLSRGLAYRRFHSS